MSSIISPPEGPRDSSLVQDTDVEYALILSQMIDVAQADPSQLRLAIYEFARAKLINNTFNKTADERRRLAQALETAIAGVEKFAEKRDKHQRVVFRHGGAELSEMPVSSAPDPALLQAISDIRKPMITTAPEAEAPIRLHPAAADRKAPLPLVSPTLFAGARIWVAGGLVAVAAVALVATLTYRLTRPDDRTGVPAGASIVRKNDPGTGAAAERGAQPSAQVRADLPFQLPTDYGTYLIQGSSVLELEPLDLSVPDKRIEMSTPITQVHQISAADGSPKFLLFRRDLANDPPQKVEVRPLARVARMTTFDARGKPTFSVPSSMWIIRNASYELRVRPVPDRPEMLLVQARDGSSELPAGRYVLSLKDKGYDFIVPGDVTDPAHCVERTEASNGSFYSACQ